VVAIIEPKLVNNTKAMEIAKNINTTTTLRSQRCCGPTTLENKIRKDVVR